MNPRGTDALTYPMIRTRHNLYQHKPLKCTACLLMLTIMRLTGHRAWPDHSATRLVRAQSAF